jgi:hypothetical protein
MTPQLLNIKSGDWQCVTDAYQITDIDQGIDAGNIPLFHQAAQESLSC